MNQLEAIEAAKEWDWAKWVAMDADGSWWAFKDKRWMGNNIKFPEATP